LYLMAFIWKIHRVSKKILSKKELQFVLQFIEKLCRALETKTMLSIVYQSQTDSQTEWINQEVEAFL